MKDLKKYGYPAEGGVAEVSKAIPTYTKMSRHIHYRIRLNVLFSIGIHIYLWIITIDKNFSIISSGLIIHESLNEGFTHVTSFKLRLNAFKGISLTSKRCARKSIKKLPITKF